MARLQLREGGGREITVQALVRKTGETKGRSGGLKIRPKRERSLATHQRWGKKPPYEERRHTRVVDVKREVERRIHTTTERGHRFSLSLSISLSPSAQHPLRLISEIDRLSVR